MVIDESKKMKNMKKRVLNCMVAAVAAVCGVSFGAGAQDVAFWVDGIHYEVRNAEGDEVSVVLPAESREDGYQYPLDAEGALVIPSTVSHGGVAYSVTGVAADAIVGQNQMLSLVLPETMVDVCNAIHGCPALKFLDLGGASHVATCGYQVGLPLLEELRMESDDEVFVESGSFYELPSLKVLRLPARFVGGDKTGDEEVRALSDCFCNVPLLAKIYSPSVIPPLVVYTTYAVDCLEFPRNGAHFIGEESVNPDACEVYIPEGTAETYRAHPSWEGFKNFVEVEGAGVESPVAAADDIVGGRVVEIFTLTGVRVLQGNLSPGVYVCRTDAGNTRKVVIR